MKEFSIRGEKPGTISPDFSVFTAKAELHREPVHRGQLLDLGVGRAQRGQADLLGELGEARVGQQRHVSDQLVDAVPAEQEDAGSNTEPTHSPFDFLLWLHVPRGVGS